MNWSNISNTLSDLIFLSFVVGIPAIALLRKVDIFNVFLAGAKDGFALSVKIIPSLCGLLVAIGMFRAAGGFELLGHALAPLLHIIHFPEPLIPLALIRPFSGSASNAVLAELAHHYGGDSYVAHLAATMLGSTETTFYVIAVYFASVNIRRFRYAIPLGLFADFVGIIAAVVVTRLYFN